MHPLPLPQVDPSAMYAASHSRVRSAALKQRYVDETENVLDGGERFGAAARSDGLDLLVDTDFAPRAASATEMIELYDLRTQPERTPGRPYYNELIAAANHSRCPYCGERRVKSLDHYLPKAAFSTLAVSPENLVPSCHDCNHAKRDYQPSATKPPLIHPYFDRVDEVRWLFAVAIESQPPGILFEVRPPASVPQRLAARLMSHFQVFGLERLFRSHAGQVIDELDSRLPQVFANGGAESVRLFLLEEAEYRSVGRLNTWQRAVFEALAESTWYCSRYSA